MDSPPIIVSRTSSKTTVVSPWGPDSSPEPSPISPTSSSAMQGYRIEQTRSVYITTDLLPSEFDQNQLNNLLDFGESIGSDPPTRDVRIRLTRSMPERPVLFYPELEVRPAAEAVEVPRRASAYRVRDSMALSPMSSTAPPVATSRRGSPRTPTRTRILFYHKTDPHYGFTNFSAHPVIYDNKRYPTSEHLFQSFKFMPHRPKLAEHIRLCSERPSVAFSEARRFAPEVRSDWKDVNIQMVRAPGSLVKINHLTHATRWTSPSGTNSRNTRASGASFSPPRMPNSSRIATRTRSGVSAQIGKEETSWERHWKDCVPSSGHADTPIPPGFRPSNTCRTRDYLLAYRSHLNTPRDAIHYFFLVSIMAALAPANAVPIPQLCDYCKQKPRHAGHPFCSKTCAAQIAALCNQCKLRPKHQNFDYCGKNCAAAAAAAGGKAPVAVGSRPAIKAAPKTTPNANGPQFGTTSIGGVTIDPMQIAKLVAQHIPQVQSFMTAVTPALGPQGQVQVQAGAPPPAPAAAQRATPKNNPFVNAGGSVPVKVNAPVVIPQAAAMTTPAAPNGASMPVPDCLIPGCGQPVHVDASTGTMSEYCSKKHREEAVSLGLVAPCIMCLALPQSESDYFCGRECREDALTKNVHP